jgi:uncharacterized protein YyaL (SSP411 family)
LSTKFTNALINETSPYLRQHAHNPVEWYPWGAEALKKAKELDKPIFLSIGYSACHWCHVMEHESFEDENIAALLNLHFVNIKVDREERPDLDQIYMHATVAMTRQGGWPMSVFLTPDLKPFFAGTYFPPQDRYGRPSFRRLLHGLINAWENRRHEVIQSAEQITQHLGQMAHIERSDKQPGPEHLQMLVKVWDRHFDEAFGGTDGAPKFPHSLELRLLLRAWKRFADERAMEMLRLTLDRMAMGGMYDHLAGGFHRYSTDERWLIPHFEKMLYDNALLSQLYVEAFQATGNPFYRDIATETLDWVLRDMTAPDGAFYSTLDADSEKVEGKFYVWSAHDLREILGQDFHAFRHVYNVTESGNWHEMPGQVVLNRTRSWAEDAQLLKLTEDDLKRSMRRCRERLLEIRNRRIWPGRDEKILTAWNGLMISALAQAGQVLDPRYTQAAARAANWMLKNLRAPDGKLFRTTFAGASPKLNAYLEDYAFLLDAFVHLYEATFSTQWIKEARALVNVMHDEFYDEQEGGFYFVGKSHEPLIVRGKEPQDNATPSGNSVAVGALLRLAKLTGNRTYEEMAASTLRLVRPLMEQAPTGFGQMLCGLDFYLGPVREYVVLGEENLPDTQRVLAQIRSRFEPRKVLAWSASAAQAATLPSPTDIPLLAGKTSQPGQVVTYLCENFACHAPIFGPLPEQACV